MARSAILGNGQMLVALDNRGSLRDLYFPYVGLEDQVRGHYIHRVGVFVDGQMSWLSDDKSWRIEIYTEDEALASRIVAVNENLKVSLNFKDLVYNERNIFIRRVEVKNLDKRSREIKLYFSHQFELYKSHGGDTAYFDPVRHAIVHYKGQRIFLINGEMDKMPFSDFSIGLANFQGHEGTHKDADDGALSKNPIEHGPVDSVVGFYYFYSGEETKTIHYWVVAAKTMSEAHSLNDYILRKTPDHLVKTTSDFWKAWVNKFDFHFHNLSDEEVILFKKSLMVIRAHADKEGGIIASTDSDMLQQGKDTYSYVWPRDGAYTASAFSKSGDFQVARRFFQFCNDVLTDGGYLMHKYLPDKSLGSSWHPWIRNGQFQLPIQEDETASVLVSLLEYYKESKDIEFIESIYNSFIEKAADFLVGYRDKKTKLPKGSYDLWEEKYGTSTYTCASVYGALMASAEFSRMLGKLAHESNYKKAADEIKEGIMTHLYKENEGVFIKMINLDDNSLAEDKTLDMSSVFGIFYFGVLDISDERLKMAMDTTWKRLSSGIRTGGLARYEGDNYFRTRHDVPGNPWFITTLWYSQYLTASAKNEEDIKKVEEIFAWVLNHAEKSGMLSEQLDPESGRQVCASPLTWSHAEYINSVAVFLRKIKELGICSECGR